MNELLVNSKGIILIAGSRSVPFGGNCQVWWKAEIERGNQYVGNETISGTVSQDDILRGKLVYILFYN